MNTPTAEGNCYNDSQNSNVLHASSPVTALEYLPISEHEDWHQRKLSSKKAANRKVRHCAQKQHKNARNKNGKSHYPFTPHGGSEYAFCEKESLSPQLGFEEIKIVPEFLQNLSEYGGVDLSDSIIREIEGLVATFLALRQVQSLDQFSAILFLYVRSHYSASVSMTVITYLEGILASDELEQQSGSENTPNWLYLLRETQQCWGLCKGNRAFKQLSQLLGILVTLGLCDAASLDFDIAGYKLFEEDLLKKHLTAFDMADAVFSTVTFFAEGAYLCFQQGSLKPLLINDSAAIELDDEYAKISSWWELVKCGNLERVASVSDGEFNRRLENLATRLRNLSSTLKGFDKKIVNDKLMVCLKMVNDYTTLKISSGVRRAPFAIELFGDSSQGKTTFGDQLLDALLTSAGLPVSKDYRAALNAADKFMSNWTSEKLVMLIDDVANEKGDFVERPPTRAIIDVCNNQMYYALKAELEAKGKCFVEPEIALITTNREDMDAGTYSNCPYSIQRRMHIVIQVVAKRCFQKIVEGIPCGIDSKKVRDFYTVDGVFTPPVIDDIWELTVKQAVRPPRLSSVASYRVVEWEGKKLENVSSSVVTQYCIEQFTIHRENQFAIVEAMKARANKMTLCGVDGCKQIKGHCHKHLEPQFGLVTAVAVERIRKRVVKRFSGDTGTFGAPLETLATGLLYKASNQFLKNWDWMCVLPPSVVQNPRFTQFALWYYSGELRKRWFAFSMGLWSLCAVVGFFAPVLAPLLFCLCLHQQLFAVNKIKRDFLDELITRNDNIAPIVKNTRDKYAKVICTSVAAIGVLYALAKIFTQWKKLQVPQSALEPKTPEDVVARDEGVNVWTQVATRTLPIEGPSRTVSNDILAGLVRKNLVYGTVEIGGDKLMVNGLFITSNVVLLPNHYFEKGDELVVTFRKEKPDMCGGKFTSRISRCASVHIPDTDLTLCYSSTGGSFRDLTKHFPIANIGNHPFTMLWRQKDGEILTARGRAESKKTTNTIATFDGGEYAYLSMDTFAGLCGAVLVSETQGCVISGLHLGGAANTPKGCYGTLTQKMILDSIAGIRAVSGTIVSGSVEKFSPQILGVTIMTDEEIHPKSPLNFMPEDSQVTYYGTCTGTVSSRSDVRRTPISKFVTSECGSENIWGAPKMRPEWFGWQKCLSNLSNPGTPYEHSLLMKAVDDYEKPLIAKAQEDMWCSMRPLTDHENINGIPGCKFVDSINLSTSIGYPLTGPKRKYVTELEPTEDAPCNRIFDDVIMNEIVRCQKLYASGFRAYTIAKACKKDEVLPISKEKCRIFYGNPISLTFNIRKYYLPILRFLQMNPLLAECAVGINSHGPEWDEFHQHVLQYGAERTFGGDYGKYDQKLPSQVLLASLRILIDIARVCDYSEEDLRIMETMTGDIVYALISFNGDLIGLTEGTHISGNSLTVIINGISGSLNLRCFFYSMYAESIKFRDAAAISTYGDDNIGTVSKDYPKFNIRACSLFLGEHGQIYTMPDKESDLVPYLPDGGFEFLKRTSVYHPELGVHIGALLETSIFKSLHCYIRGRKAVNTVEQACALNVDCALREWFNHGPEVYEKRRKEMVLVAEKGEITHICDGLFLSYAERAADWRTTYG